MHIQLCACEKRNGGKNHTMPNCYMTLTDMTLEGKTMNWLKNLNWKLCLEFFGGESFKKKS